MASQMFETGKILLRIGLTRQNKALDEKELRAKVFLRLYGKDFSSAEINRIVATIPDMKLENESQSGSH